MDAISVPQTPLDIVVRLVVATLFGAAVGLNREWVQKPAGLRTHALAGLGAALLTIVGCLLEPVDPASLGRILQGIVAGIGFIGGGVILHRPQNADVQGLTTAAAIWVVTAIGIAVGAGLWWTASAALVLALLVLAGGDAIDRAIHNWRERRRR
jgi:putative Mg2+ transporter-C (MgtC) family protein